MLTELKREVGRLVVEDHRHCHRQDPDAEDQSDWRKKPRRRLAA